MCGRFSQFYTWQELQELYDLSVPAIPNLEPRYNISPTDPVDVVLAGEDGHHRFEKMRWWLVPWWWTKTLKDVPPAFNARAETAAAKPMFRDAFQRHRCLIPASGFYEWTGPKEARQPWFFSARDGKPLTFAGLYDRWKDPVSGETVRSCTILITEANHFMRPIHDRMPVILPREEWNAWLADPRSDLLKPAHEGVLVAWKVSPRMNSNRYIEPDAPVSIE